MEEAGVSGKSSGAADDSNAGNAARDGVGNFADINSARGNAATINHGVGGSNAAGNSHCYEDRREDSRPGPGHVRDTTAKYLGK